MHAQKILLVVAMAGVMAVSLNLRAEDTPEEAALRARLRNTASDSATPAISAVAPASQPRMLQPVAAPSMQYAPAGEFAAVPAANPNHDALIGALRTQPGTIIPPTTATTTVSIPPPSVSPTTSGATPDYAPIKAPALPISGTKEQRLDALLILYKADQLTPEQYHKQRAAILAGQ